MRLLRSDANRAVVGVTGAHAQATDGLYRCVRHRDRVGAQRHCLDEIRGQAQAAGDYQRDIIAALLITRFFLPDLMALFQGRVTGSFT